MITSTQLQALGYTRRESYNIMRRLKERNCTIKQVKIYSNYQYKGTTRTLTNFCDSIDVNQALVALTAYLANLPKECNRQKWEAILKTLTEWKAKQDEKKKIEMEKTA